MTFSSLLDRMLIVATIALGGYLAATASAPTQAEMDARKNNVLPAFDPSTIESISWSTSGGEPVHLRRDSTDKDETRYYLGKTGKRLADAGLVREMISALDFSTWNREIDDTSGIEAEQLGFSSPQLELNIAAGPRTYRMVFGNQAPSPAQSIYLKVEGTNIDTKVGAVSEEMLTQLARSPQEFFGGLLFPYGKSETSTLRLEHEGTQTTLKATADGFMVARKGKPSLLADRTLLDLIFFHLARAKVSHYIDEAQFTASTHVTQVTGEGTNYRVALGGDCPEDPVSSIIARRESPDPVLGCVPRSILPALWVSSNELVSQTGSAMNPDEIDHVVVEGTRRSVDVIRRGADYQLLSRDGTVIPQESGDELFAGYGQAKLKLLHEPPGETEKLATVTLKGQLQNNPASPAAAGGSDHSHREQIEVHRKEQTLFILRKIDKTWLEVPPNAAWLYSTSDDWARDKKLSDWDSDDIMAVKVHAPDGFSQEIERTEDGFNLSSSEGAPADPSLTREMLGELSRLSALRFISPPRDKPPGGLFEIVFKVKQDDATTTHSIYLGERIRGGYLAWSTITDGTFVFPLEARVPFYTPLNDRQSFRIDPEDQQRIELNLGERSFVFERQAGALRGVGGEATDDMAEPLVSAIHAISVISAAGDHPQAAKLNRGTPFLSISASRASENPEQPSAKIKLNFGAPVVWRGTSARLAWVEGSRENFFVGEASLAELLELL